MQFRDRRFVRDGLQLRPKKLSGLIVASLAQEPFRPHATGRATEFSQISVDRRKQVAKVTLEELEQLRKEKQVESP